MDSYLLEIVKKTTDYIESNILESLNLDSISGHVNVSKFHLLRIWKGATSTGLMEYVRRRRIALSLVDLLHSPSSVEFISSKYSFGSERAYNRVFKDEFLLTPAKWRRNPCPLSILDRFNADFMWNAGSGIMFFRSVTVLPALTIAGPEYAVDMEENMKSGIANRLGVDFFYNHRPRVINPVEKDVYIGFTSVPEPAEGYTYYQPSVQVSKNSIIPDGMKVKQIPPHKYGVFTYMGPHSPEEISSATLSDIWQYVFSVWMPTVRFDLNEIFSFERIDYSKCSKKYCECNLYYPISVL
jgi:AraC family transcriptional regulator